MAVDVTQIGVVYQALMGNAENTLTEQFDAGYIKGADYATVLSQVMTSAMQLATTATLDQPLKDAQVLDMKVKDFVMLAESEKDRQLKDAQIELANSQIDMEDGKIKSLDLHDRLDAADNAMNLELKQAQKDLILLQQTTEDSKAALTDRQILGYNDQTRVKRAEILGNTIGMFGAGGTAIPAGFEAAALQAAKDVSTELLMIPAVPVVPAG